MKNCLSSSTDSRPLGADKPTYPYDTEIGIYKKQIDDLIDPSKNHPIHDAVEKISYGRGRYDLIVVLDGVSESKSDKKLVPIGRMLSWDLARFCVSLFLAADHGRGILAGRYSSEGVGNRRDLRAPGQEDALRAASTFLKAYRRTCAAIVDQPERRMGAVEEFGKGHVLAKPRKKARKRAAGGKDFESKSSLGKAVECASGRPRLRPLTSV